MSVIKVVLSWGGLYLVLILLYLEIKIILAALKKLPYSLSNVWPYIHKKQNQCKDDNNSNYD